MTTNLTAGYQPVNDAPSDSKYRLWRTFSISQGKPNTILVHGAVVPEFTQLYVKDAPNSTKLCSFHELGTLLHDKCGHNVWEFEYADICVRLLGEERCVNYGDLNDYGDRLANAITIVKSKNQDGAVNIIAHSMGGLVARCAAQKMSEGTINKIVTLDTGHFGFEIDAFVTHLLSLDNLPPILKPYIEPDVRCTEQVKPGCEFLYELAKNFSNGKSKLLSVAASDAVPVISARVVSWTSSSLVQISGDGSTTYDPENTKFSILHGYNHLSIVEIYDDNHPAFAQIKSFLCDSVDQPVSQPSGDSYFTVVLSEKPQLGCPKLWSKQHSPLGTISDSIHEKSGYRAVVFTVGSDVDDPDIKIELAPNKCADGKLTKGQSTIWWTNVTRNC